MKVYWGGDSYSRASRESATAVRLADDRWDDFGFKTLFHLKLWMGGQWHDVGETKILHRDQVEGRTVLPRSPFESLGTDYCSLGQSIEFYERLLELLGSSRTIDLLSGLNDFAARPELVESFPNGEGIQTSLLRSSAADSAWRGGRELLSEGRLSGVGNRIVFSTSVGGSEFELNLQFDQSGILPGRIHALIGYNGCGKTTLLANLANAAAKAHRDASPFRGDPPRFGSVMVVSYSAFDDFEVPSLRPSSSQALSNVYRGLREVAPPREDREATNEESGERAGGTAREAPAVERAGSVLKSLRRMEDELVEALDVARSMERRPTFDAVMRPLLQEPSFRTHELQEWLSLSQDDLRDRIRPLSSGHKIVLHIATGIVAYLQKNSLLVLDEPESHLHPPLLAALMRAISTGLEERQSLCVLATHSPVVLQEIPARHVTVIVRHGTLTETRTPRIETFAENIALLTREVFDLDNSKSDYRATLARLAETGSLEQIRSLFGGQLSSQALAHLSSLISEE